MRRIGCALALAALTAGCTAAPQDAAAPAGLTAEDETAIRAVIAEWDRAFEANDMAAATALYTDDYIEARSTAVVGPEAARQVYEGFPMRYTEMHSTVERLEGRADVAWAWVSFDARFTRNTSERRVQTGNSIWVLRKDTTGQWRLAGSGFSASSVPDSAAS